jgi:hypothetical protein
MGAISRYDAAMTKQIAASALDAATLRKALDYDPETGLLFWRRRDDVPPKVNNRFAGKPAGGRDGQYGYITVRLYDRLYQAHRLVWLHVHGVWPDAVLDHIDGNPTNNRIDNLRPATRAENNRNRAKAAGTISKLKGVTRDKRTGLWIAQIMISRKQHYLGQYLTEIGAHRAYCEAAARLHGAFARTE